MRPHDDRRAVTTDPREALCPYPGLEAFTAENRQYFFGRERDTQLLISNLYAAPLTVVYGASGVGKTSVILAGVVPEVEREGEALIFVHRTWQDAARARSLAATLAGDTPSDANLPLDVVAQEAAERWRRPIFLVFDQFEEYFLYNEASDATDSLDGELARLINRRDVDVHVMIVMREDSLAALDRFRHRIPTLLNNLYRLEHLTHAEALRAIEAPLEVLRREAPEGEIPVAIEPHLATVVLNDLATLDDTDAEAGVAPRAATTREIQVPSRTRRDETRVELPFLQVVLERIWILECRARSALLRHATFTRAGGARGIVRDRVAEVLDRLSPRDQDIVAAVLRHLVTPSGGKLALTLADLAGYAGTNEEEVAAVVDRLIAGGARILRRVAHPTLDPALTKFEIYHDALGAPLLAWRVAMDRVRAARQRRTKFLVRGFVAALALLAVVAAAIGVFLQRGKRRLEARELAGIATAQLDVDNGRALLVALSSIDRSATENAGEVVLRRALFEPGERVQDTITGIMEQLMASPDGRFVAGIDRNRRPFVWTADSLRALLLPPALEGVTALAFDSAGHLLLATAGRAVFVTVDGSAPPEEVPTTRSTEPPAEMYLHRDGTRGIIAYTLGTIREVARNDDGWSETVALPQNVAFWQGLIVSPDERTMAFVTTEQRLALVALDRRPWEVHIATPARDTVIDAVFAGNRDVGYVTRDGTVRVLSIGASGEGETVPLSCRVERIAYANGEGVSPCADHGLILYNLPVLMSQMRMGTEPPLVTRQGRLRAPMVSRDGRFVMALADGDLAPSVWSIYSRSEVLRLRGHRGEVTAFTILPDSRHVITASADSTIRRWEIVSSTERIGDGEFMAGRATVQLSDAATHAAMASPYGVQLWDFAARRAVVEEPVRGDPSAVAAAPVAPRVATALSFGLVQEFTVRDRSPARAPGEPDDSSPVLSEWFVDIAGFGRPSGGQGDLVDSTSILRYVGQGDTLLLAANARRRDTVQTSALARIVRSPPGAPVVARFTRRIGALAVDPTGAFAALRLSDGRVVLQGTAPGSAGTDVPVPAGGAVAVAFAPDGSLALSGRNGEVRLAAPPRVPAAEGGTVPAAVTLGTHDRAVVQLVFDRTGAVLASGDEGGATRLWSTASRTELCALDGQHADAIGAIAFAPSGRTVATADERGVALWFIDPEGRSCRFAYRLADLESPTRALRFAADGSALVVVGRDGITRRYLRSVWAPRDSLMALAQRRLRGRTLTASERTRYLTPR